MIVSFIPITLTDDSGVLLMGESICLSLLGVKGLFISIIVDWYGKSEEHSNKPRANYCRLQADERREQYLDEETKSGQIKEPKKIFIQTYIFETNYSWLNDQFELVEAFLRTLFLIIKTSTEICLVAIFCWLFLVNVIRERSETFMANGEFELLALHF